jgi:hypothetical protein
MHWPGVLRLGCSKSQSPMKTCQARRSQCNKMVILEQKNNIFHLKQRLSALATCKTCDVYIRIARSRYSLFFNTILKNTTLYPIQIRSHDPYAPSGDDTEDQCFFRSRCSEDNPQNVLISWSVPLYVGGYIRDQGDQIWRIVASWAIVNFGQFSESYRSSPKAWPTFFLCHSYFFIFEKMWTGLHFGH